MLKINNQYLLTFVYEETLNCLKSHKNKRLKINMQYYLNDKKLNKIEKQKAEKDGLKIFEELDDYALKGWEEMDEVDLQMRLKWYGLFWRPKTPGRFMMRLRVPNGILNSNQLRVIASIVARYGEDGSADITTRQNIQLRGVLINDLPDIIKRLREVDITSVQSGMDNPRNVTGNPLAGIDPEEIIDTRKYTSELENYLTNSGNGNPEFSNLPRKWNTAVAGAKDNFLLHNDLIFHPVFKNGILGFGVWVGGILSATLNAYAIPLDVWVEEKDICKITGIICSLWRDNGDRFLRNKGRFRYYLNSIGIEKFRELVEEKFGTLSNDPGSIFNEKQRSLFGINKQKQNNLYFAGLHIPVGRLCVEDIQEIARLSEKYGQSEVRLTEDQNLIIVGLKDNILEEFGNEEIINKFKLNPSHFSASTVSCTGSSYCSFALANTKDIARNISEKLDRELELSEEVKIHWTGCPNNCGQAHMGGIGMTGTKVKKEGGGTEDGYNVSIGGRQDHLQTLGETEFKKVSKHEIYNLIKEILINKFNAKLKT